MEIKQYMALVQRWAWLLILGLIFGAVGGYLGSRYQEPVYQAGTKFIVTRSTSQSSDTTSYVTSQQLFSTYVQLVTTEPVMDIASERLAYKVVSSQIKVQAILNTQIIDITVEDTDPSRASEIANMLVEVLIEQNDTI